MGKKIILVLIIVLLLVSVAGCYKNVTVSYEYGLVIDKQQGSRVSFPSTKRTYTVKVELANGSVVDMRGYEAYDVAEVGEKIWLRVVRTENGTVTRVSLGGKG